MGYSDAEKWVGFVSGPLGELERHNPLTWWHFVVYSMPESMASAMPDPDAAVKHPRPKTSRYVRAEHKIVVTSKVQRWPVV